MSNRKICYKIVKTLMKYGIDINLHIAKSGSVYIELCNDSSDMIRISDHLPEELHKFKYNINTREGSQSYILDGRHYYNVDTYKDIFDNVMQ